MDLLYRPVFTTTVDNILFKVYEFDDHFVACQDDRPVLVCNIDDDINSLLSSHLHPVA